MSERYCPGCGRPLPWTWPEGASLEQIGNALRKGLPLPPSGSPPDAIQAPTCYQVPASYMRGSIEHRGACAEQGDWE